MKKSIISAICIILILGLTIGTVACKNQNLKVSYLRGNYAIDISDPAAVVGSKDYVFVCEVLEVEDCNIKFSRDELPKSIMEVDTPMTKCRVKVLKNLKGNLKEGETIIFYKEGGLSNQGKILEIYKNDLMPQPNKIYIFMGYGQYDGTITGGGENGTIFLCNSNKKYLETKIYNEYIEYVNKQVDPPIAYPHYLAYADVNFGDGSINKKIDEEFNSSTKQATTQSLEELIKEKLDYAKKNPVDEYIFP